MTDKPVEYTFKPSPASESYACYSDGNTILVLSTDHVDLGALKFAEGTALIYAETVTHFGGHIGSGKKRRMTGVPLPTEMGNMAAMVNQGDEVAILLVRKALVAMAATGQGRTYGTYRL
ncbi:predicted protein [Chaetomium globosum CBS 148.51]|uniref:Uncharacterized protein n=1 Tax=Chaetomium globosum (strain ATCC 6205 / CBS 148.51 / DSM 1962 / NBRC 6347 / NRRL 1970) TaxID=306901 RepID=Q2HBG4_CHAGB|nr:uncharacterized protein CHGG_02440 [Chaetomium globosum CBS 148.51]EAQ90505.1 predicted protein [Chaetomium globosum CBS 148.51]